MAKQSPLALVEMPGESEGMTKSRQTYIDAQQKMLEALESRNQLFDPVLLALAQGLLSPTKSGSFGEGIANAAAAVAPAMEQERKKNIEMAQIRAELAAGQYGAAQKGEALKALTGTMQPGKQEQTVTVGGQEYPAQFVGMTPQDAMRISMYDKELGDLAFKFLKAQQDEIQVRENVAFNVRTGQTTPFAGGPPVSIYVPELGGNIEMSRRDQVELDEARRRGDGKTVRQIINRLTQPLPETTPGASSAAPTTETPTPGAEGPAARPPAITIQERERRKEEEKAQLETKTAGEKKLAETAAGRTSQVFEQASAAKQTDPTYARIETILKEPGIDTVMGVLERNGALAQIGSLVEEAIRVGNYSIGIPTIRKVLTNAGTPQHLIDRAMELTSSFAQLNFDARKGLGSGTSVSNFEQMMVNQMGLSMMDTAASAKAKLAFLREQAKFRQQVGSALKEARKKSPGLQYDDFEETPEFTSMFDAYKARQEANVKRAGQPETPRGEVIQPGRPAAPRAGISQERKIDGKTYVRQPDGSYKLKE
jgi:hypothetical protein